MDKRPPCPRCRSSEAVPFVYGMPLEGAFKEEAEGKIKLGGDVITLGLSPEWYCKACGNEWGLYQESD